MSEKFGPIDILCDAPPYSVVRACQRLGFTSPADVRWCRVSQLAGTPATGIIAWFRGSGKVTCSCGRKIPRLENYTFTFVNGKQSQYYLGQCSHCRSIFWDLP